MSGLEFAGRCGLSPSPSRPVLVVAKAEKEIKGLAGRLSNPHFANKAPAAVVSECKAKLAEAVAHVDLARRRLADLG